MHSDMIGFGSKQLFDATVLKQTDYFARPRRKSSQVVLNRAQEVFDDFALIIQLKQS